MADLRVGVRALRRAVGFFRRERDAALVGHAAARVEWFLLYVEKTRHL